MDMLIVIVITVIGTWVVTYFLAVVLSIISAFKESRKRTRQDQLRLNNTVRELQMNVQKVGTVAQESLHKVEQLEKRSGCTLCRRRGE